jgi:hypothetical protein
MHTDERRGFVVTRTGCERESVGQTRTPCKEKRIAPFRLGNVGAIMDDKRVEWNGDKEQKAIDVLSASRLNSSLGSFGTSMAKWPSPVQPILPGKATAAALRGSANASTTRPTSCQRLKILERSSGNEHPQWLHYIVLARYKFFDTIYRWSYTRLDERYRFAESTSYSLPKRPAE